MKKSTPKGELKLKLVEEAIDANKHLRIVGDFYCGADDPLDTFLKSESFRYHQKNTVILILYLQKHKTNYFHSILLRQMVF